ncbi:MAG: hypothetical protein R3A11_06675 [Bdellovibrionota bacterium]
MSDFFSREARENLTKSNQLFLVIKTQNFVFLKKIWFNNSYLFGQYRSFILLRVRILFLKNMKNFCRKIPEWLNGLGPVLGKIKNMEDPFLNEYCQRNPSFLKNAKRRINRDSLGQFLCNESSCKSRYAEFECLTWLDEVLPDDIKINYELETDEGKTPDFTFELDGQRFYVDALATTQKELSKASEDLQADSSRIIISNGDQGSSIKKALRKKIEKYREYRNLILFQKIDKEIDFQEGYLLEYLRCLLDENISNDAFCLISSLNKRPIYYCFRDKIFKSFFKSCPSQNKGKVPGVFYGCDV